MYEVTSRKIRQEIFYLGYFNNIFLSIVIYSDDLHSYNRYKSIDIIKH